MRINSLLTQYPIQMLERSLDSLANAQKQIIQEKMDFNQKMMKFTVQNHLMGVGATVDVYA